MTWILGAYEVLRKVGEGGMASVYLARHRQTGAEVAVKVMTGALASRPHYREAFWREAQSVARLHHPNIVAIHDVGVVSEESARSGLFVVEAPYIAMDYVGEGTLEDHLDGLSWSRLRALMLQVLDALAHAHARGVIHRDLKPANVLFGKNDVAQITDFGIAHLDVESQARRVEERVTGTPRYMAPEQIRGRLREQGPWTDLYSFGVMVWRLSSGKAPFSGDSDKMLRDHLMTPLPSFMPRLAVPDGFEDWVARLLEKRPQDRFQRAADAAHALLELELITASRAGQKLPQFYITSEMELTSLVGLAITGEMAPLTPGGPETSFSKPAVPESWRLARDEVRGEIRAGTGVFSLRVPPLVGREDERDLLWRLLRDAATHRSRLALITGDEGVGKSRLAGWLSERAHELGVVERLETSHSSEASAGEGLAGLLSRALRTTGMEAFEVATVLRDFRTLDAVDVELLATWLAGELPVRVSRREKFISVARLLTALAEERPLVVVCDRIEFGPETAAFIRFVLDEHPQIPVLFLALALDRESVAALAERADSVMRLTPLRKAEVERLINAMVMLDEHARAALVRQSNGNPMFALQWLKSAILQGMVRETPAGYTIADGIAADLKGLWGQRVELALRDDSSGAARAALLSGAVLGVDVELDTWRALAMHLGSDPVNFLPWMVQLGLAEYAPDGWRFATPQLRAQLCEAARQAGIWKSLNAAAAQVLTRAARVDHWRVGNHQVEAAESAAAIDSFMLAAEDLLLSGEFERVEAALERRDALMDRLRVDAKDERRGAALRCRASNFYRRGQRDEFREFARKGMVLAVQMGWSVVHAELMVAFCESQILSGEIDEVFRQMPEALGVLERAGNVVRLSEAHRVYAAALVASGRMDDALPHLDLATSLARRCEDPNMLATAFWERGDYLRSLADYEGARQAFSGALEIYEGLGARVGCGWAHNALGDLSRLLGEFAQAAHHLNKAHELFKGVGAREVIGVEANLAMLALARGDWDDAVERFEVCYRETTADGAHFYRMLSVLGMVAGEMCRGAVGEAMRWMALYEELASQANYFDPDLLTLSTLARDRVPSGLADFRTRLDAVVSAQQPDR